MNRHFITIHELTAKQVNTLLDESEKVKKNPQAYEGRLQGKVLAMLFAKASTRTRVSFQVGIYQLGGTGMYLPEGSMQLNRGELLSDTAQVLSRYVDGIMARTHRHADVLELANHASIPVINGLTDLLHPCQAMADLLTIREKFGRTKGLTLSFVGDGNNVAHSLMFAAAKAGMDFVCVTPPGYEMDRATVELGRKDAKTNGTKIIESNDLDAVSGASVVYTDVWASMGQEEETQQRQMVFHPYQVNNDVMARAKEDAVFMHCLPAHRTEEVSAAVCDGPQSVIFDQAENRLHVQKAIMLDLMG